MYPRCLPRSFSASWSCFERFLAASRSASEPKIQGVFKSQNGYSPPPECTISVGVRGKPNSRLKADFVTMYEPYVGICSCNQVDIIENIGVCFESLCRLFFRDPRSDINVFSAEKNYMLDTYWGRDLERKLFKKFYSHNIVRQALEFVVGNKIVVKYECDFSESWRMYVKQLLSKDEFVKIFNDKTDDPKKVCFECFDLSENELRKKYYKHLIDKYKTKTKAAEHAGLKCSTFSKRLEQLDFSQG